MFLSLIFLLSTCAVFAKPEQVVLSLTNDPTIYSVTWISLKPLKENSYPFVQFGTSEKKLLTLHNATTTEWADQGIGKTVRYTFRAFMDRLQPGRRYYYAVGSSQSMSTTFNYVAVDPANRLRLAIYGDLSAKDGYSIPSLIAGTRKNDFDVVVHIGDIAYDLDGKNGSHGDDFMNEMENVTAYVPFMVLAGNHEDAQNFSHIANRFTMPPNGIVSDNQFWSFTLGDAHVVGISSEYYGENISDLAQLQYSWLLTDFKKSNSTWKIVLMHRPLYCANDHKKGCHDWENLSMRDGAPGYPALEPLFNAAGVDMIFWGHQHSYERNWPVAKSTAYPQPVLQHYHNASTPVYIMTGSAGCHSHQDVILKLPQPYTAVMLGQYGYSLLNVVSGSLLTTRFVDVNDSDNNLDKFSLSKDPNFKPGVQF